MNYLFFGTPDFSAHCLEILLKHGLVPKAVVCNPDRPTGRKKIITPPPVKTAAEVWNKTHGTNIQILQPEKLDAPFIETLRSFDADFFLVFAYNKIFRKNILEIPRRGMIGIHPSFLPKYRGPSPFQTALLNGDLETGVTLYLLDEGVDAGPIIATSEPVAIGETDTFHSLAIKLADTGAKLVMDALPTFLDRTLKGRPQDEAQATFTKKFKTEDGFIDPADLIAAEQGDIKKALAIMNKIRAFTPEPGCWTIKNGKRLKLLAATREDDKLRLREIQEEGQKAKTVF